MLKLGIQEAIRVHLTLPQKAWMFCFLALAFNQDTLVNHRKGSHLMHEIRSEIVRRPHHHAGRDMVLVGAEDGDRFPGGLAGVAVSLGGGRPDPSPASIVLVRCPLRRRVCVSGA